MVISAIHISCFSRQLLSERTTAKMPNAIHKYKSNMHVAAGDEFLVRYGLWDYFVTSTSHFASVPPQLLSELSTARLSNQSKDDRLTCCQHLIKHGCALCVSAKHHVCGECRPSDGSGLSLCTHAFRCVKHAQAAIVHRRLYGSSGQSPCAPRGHLPRTLGQAWRVRKNPRAIHNPQTHNS